MFASYRSLRKGSSQSRWRCIKFQLFVWRLNLKYWPSDMRYRRWLKKQDPEKLKKVVTDIRKLLE